MSTKNGSATAPRCAARRGARGDRRRRQLRLLVRAGRRVLQGRRTGTTSCPGLMHVDLGGYHVRDIEFTAAFDIDADKVGKDLSEAIWSGPEQHDQVRRRAEARRQGPARHDPRRPRQVPQAEDQEGAGRDRRHRRDPARRPRPTSSSPTCRSAPSRRPSGTSSRRSRPAAASSTASRSSSRASTTGRSASRRPALPIIGDDIKSQVGATIVHRMLARLFRERGVRLERT